MRTTDQETPALTWKLEGMTSMTDAPAAVTGPRGSLPAAVKGHGVHGLRAWDRGDTHCPPVPAHAGALLPPCVGARAAGGHTLTRHRRQEAVRRHATPRRRLRGWGRLQGHGRGGPARGSARIKYIQRRPMPGPASRDLPALVRA
jgi:hypothetical protein